MCHTIFKLFMFALIKLLTNLSWEFYYYFAELSNSLKALHAILIS